MTPSVRLSKLHFIGIGGAGMSAIAEVLQAEGFILSGSDQQVSARTRHLQVLGMDVQIGHRQENVPACDAVVFSSAVPANNPELIYAKEKGIPVLRRAELLGEITREKYTLAIAGTHGKTTTTAMLAEIYLAANRPATCIVGGVFRQSHENKNENENKILSHNLILEADEFDHTFLSLWPSVCLINNIDADHLDCYANLEAIADAFVAFTKRLPFYGLTLVNADDLQIQKNQMRFFGKIKTFSLQKTADYQAQNVQQVNLQMHFDLLCAGKILGRIRLQVPGLHNVYNALGAASVALEEGLPFYAVAQGLEKFAGMKRRFEFIGEANGVRLYDDYGHHPTEVSVTLAAAKKMGAARVIAILQPHLFTRTRDHYPEFAEALKNCDAIFVTSVYASREKPIEGIEGHLIVEALPKEIQSKAWFIKNMENLVSFVTPHLKSGDCVMILGAGDINQYGPKILEALK